MTVLNAPTVTATALDSEARVALTVTVPDPGGSAGLTVQRSTDSGATWVEVRSATGLIYTSAATVNIYDYEQAGTGATSYRARLFDTAAPATVGAWSGTVQVNADVRTWWLIDAVTPTVAVRVRPEWGTVTMVRTRDQGVFAPLGSSRHIVVNGARRGERIELAVVCDGAAALAALDAVLDTGGTCILRDDAGHLWYVQPGPERPAELQPTADRAERPMYRVTLTLQEVAAP